MLGYDVHLSQGSAISESMLLLKNEQIKRAQETLLSTIRNDDEYDFSFWNAREDIEWLYARAGERKA